jgi:signal transduction histidine kinase
MSESLAKGLRLLPERSVKWGAVAIGLLAAAAVGLVTSRNPQAAPSGDAVLVRVSIIAALIAAGAFALTKKIQARMGALLVVAGLYSSVWLLNGSGNSVLFSVGMLCSAIAPAVPCYLMLAQPIGRIRCVVEQRFLGLTAATTALLWIAAVMTSAQPPMRTPLLRCMPRCPDNAFDLGASDADLTHALTVSLRIVWVAMVAGTVAVLVRRWRSAPAAAQQSLIPMLLVAGVNLACLMGYFVARGVGAIHTMDMLGTAYVASSVIVSAAILMGLALERLNSSIAELSDSRLRLLQVTDDERSRLERVLHDGVFQDLVVLRIKLHLGASQAAIEPLDTPATFAALGDEVDRVLDGVRDLARDIYPSLIRAQGLAEALRSAAMRGPLPVTVDAERVGRYAPELEIAVYFSCVEILDGLARGPLPGDFVRVSLRERRAQLRFEVAAIGRDEESSAGLVEVELAPVRARIEALGGAVSIERPGAGGLVVLGSVPTRY